METHVLARPDGFFVAEASRTGAAYTRDIKDAQRYESKEAAMADRRGAERPVSLQDWLERVVV